MVVRRPDRPNDAERQITIAMIYPADTEDFNIADLITYLLNIIELLLCVELLTGKNDRSLNVNSYLQLLLTADWSVYR